MALLKKIRASTLMETMVATILIVIIFMVASLIMNSLMAAQVTANTGNISERLHRLEYQYVNGLLQLPYQEDWNDWSIRAILEKDINVPVVRLEATHKTSQKNLESILVANDPF
ncbi:hypothetical protein FGF1_15010 [Flavobacteriaceae bacterium GF1]